jgi:AmmeMemoRadiSam system protein A
MEVGSLERVALLALARLAVEHALEGKPPPAVEPPLQALREHQAAFVTLRRRDTGQLRGCRGECPARRPLPDCVRRIAVSAALEDPRFHPVTRSELPLIRFEISALSPPRPVRAEDVTVGKHGLIVSTEGALGLLLPQVPVEQGWDREAFLDGVCHKAGLPGASWRDPDLTLEAFEAEVWAEG